MNIIKEPVVDLALIHEKQLIKEKVALAIASASSTKDLEEKHRLRMVGKLDQTPGASNGDIVIEDPHLIAIYREVLRWYFPEYDLGREIGHELDHYNRAIENDCDAVIVVSLGIDYKKSFWQREKKVDLAVAPFLYYSFPGGLSEEEQMRRMMDVINAPERLSGADVSEIKRIQTVLVNGPGTS